MPAVFVHRLNNTLVYYSVLLGLGFCSTTGNESMQAHNNATPSTVETPIVQDKLGEVGGCALCTVLMYHILRLYTDV